MTIPQPQIFGAAGWQVRRSTRLAGFAARRSNIAFVESLDYLGQDKKYQIKTLLIYAVTNNILV
jgi:hypothetical protein